MSTEIKTFNTLEGANLEIKKRSGVWRVKHNDFENDIWKVTFVNGVDDTTRDTIPLTRKQILSDKMKDDTATITEIREYLS